MKNECLLSKEKLAKMLNEEEVAVYTSLKIMFDRMRTDKDKIIVFVNTQNLYYELTGSFEITRTDKNRLENGIKSLIKNKVVNLIDTDNKGNYVLDISNLYIYSKEKGEAYTKVYIDEIRKVMKIQFKQKYNLLRFALSVYGTIYNDSKCGFASIAKLQEISKISNKTVIEMMKILEANNIFYVCHSNTAKRDSDGKIKQLSNVYGRPENKTAIYNCYLKRLQKQGHDFTNKMTSQRKAQITRDYNKFTKGNYKDDVLKLIKNCLKYNELPYVEQKDMSIFNKKDVEKMKEEIKNEIKEDKKESLDINTELKIKSNFNCSPF